MYSESVWQEVPEILDGYSSGAALLKSYSASTRLPRTLPEQIIDLLMTQPKDET